MGRWRQLSWVIILTLNLAHMLPSGGSVEQSNRDGKKDADWHLDGYCDFDHVQYLCCVIGYVAVELAHARTIIAGSYLYLRSIWSQLAD
jgi:hypothetical protein